MNLGRRQHECAFCRIIANEDPSARIVSRSRGVTVFLPDNPATKGHVLVVPDRHIPDVWGLNQGAARNLASEVLRVAHAVRDLMNPDGLNVIQSNGAAATQTVNHLHVHVVPRWDADAMGDIWPDQDPVWTPADLDGVRSGLETTVDASKPVGYDMSLEQDREDRRKHLEFISSAIGRMAASSAAAKGWSVTLAGAAFGVALVRDSWPFFALGMLVLVAFAILDSRYLENERRARGVYDAVADDNTVVPLSMRGLATAASPSRWWWPKKYLSWSVMYFYGPLVVVGGILLIIALTIEDASASGAIESGLNAPIFRSN